MKKSFSKRITAVFLAVVMLVSSVPFVSLAADDAIVAPKTDWTLVASSDFTALGAGQDLGTSATRQIPVTSEGGNAVTWTANHVSDKNLSKYGTTITTTDEGLYIPNGYLYVSGYGNNSGLPVNGAESFKIDLEFTLHHDSYGAWGTNSGDYRAFATLGTSQPCGFENAEATSPVYAIAQRTWGDVFSGGNAIFSSSDTGFGLCCNNGRITGDTTYHYVMQYAHGYVRTYVTDANGRPLMSYAGAAASINTSMLRSLCFGADNADGYGMGVTYSKVKFYSGVDADTVKVDKDMSRDKYLFAYFCSNTDETIKFAVSDDGLNFEALNGNNPIMDLVPNQFYPAGGESQGIPASGHARDPFIVQARNADGTVGKGYYVVATDLNTSKQTIEGVQDSWGNSKFLIWYIDDLTNADTVKPWSVETVHWYDGNINLSSFFAWAPEVVWDYENQAYMIYFSGGDEGYNNLKLHYAYTKDFKTFYKDGACTLQLGTTVNGQFIECERMMGPNMTKYIDANITFNGERYYMFFKDESAQQIRYATSESACGPYTGVTYFSDSDYKDGCEGPEVYQLNDSSYIMMMDYYKITPSTFLMYSSANLETFQTVGGGTSYVTNANINHLSPRHGAVTYISTDEYNALINKFGKSTFNNTGLIDGTPVNDTLVARYFTTADTEYDATGNGYTLTNLGAGVDAAIHDGRVAGKFVSNGATCITTPGSNGLTVDNGSHSYLDLSEMLANENINHRDGVTFDWYGYTSVGGIGRYFDVSNGGIGSINWVDSTTPNYAYSYVYTSASGEFGADNNKRVYDYANQSPSPYLNKWHHFTLTMTHSYLSLYIDGVLQRTVFLKGKYDKNGGPLYVTEMDEDWFNTVFNGSLRFGASCFNGDAMFDGYISDFRIYNRALSYYDIEESIQLLTAADTGAPLDGTNVDSVRGYYDPMENMDTNGDGTNDKTAYTATVVDSIHNNVLNTAGGVASHNPATTANVADSDKGYTVSMFYNPGSSIGTEAIFNIGNGAGGTSVFELSEDGQLGFWNNGAGYIMAKNVFGDSKLEPNTWSHITLQVIPNAGFDQIYIYINGSLVNVIDTYVDRSNANTLTKGESIISYLKGTHNVYYGISCGHIYGTGTAVNGYIDDFAIYSGIFNAMDIYANDNKSIADKLIDLAIKEFKDKMATVDDNTNNVFTNMGPAYAAYDKACRYKDALMYGGVTPDPAHATEIYMEVHNAVASMGNYSKPQTIEGMNQVQAGGTSSVIDKKYTQNMLSYRDIMVTVESQVGSDNAKPRFRYNANSFVWLYDGVTTETAPMNGGIYYNSGLFTTKGRDFQSYYITGGDIAFGGLGTAVTGRQYDGYWYLQKEADTNWYYETAPDYFAGIASDTVTIRPTDEKWTSGSNYITYTGTPSNDTYWTSTTPAYQTRQGTGNTVNSDANISPIYIINYVPVKNALFDSTRVNILANITNYDPDSAQALLDAYDALTSQNYLFNTVSESDVKSLASTLETKVNNLKAIDLTTLVAKADYTTLGETAISYTDFINNAKYDTTTGLVIADSVVGDGSEMYTRASWNALYDAYLDVIDHFASLHPYGDDNHYETRNAVINRLIGILNASKNNLMAVADYSPVDDVTATGSDTYNAAANGIGASYLNQNYTYYSWVPFEEAYNWADELSDTDTLIRYNTPKYTINFSNEGNYATGRFLPVDKNGNYVTNKDDAMCFVYIDTFYEYDSATGTYVESLDYSGNYIKRADGTFMDVAAYRHGVAGVDWNSKSSSQTMIDDAAADAITEYNDLVPAAADYTVYNATVEELKKQDMAAFKQDYINNASSVYGLVDYNGSINGTETYNTGVSFDRSIATDAYSSQVGNGYVTANSAVYKNANQSELDAQITAILTELTNANTNTDGTKRTQYTVNFKVNVDGVVTTVGTYTANYGDSLTLDASSVVGSATCNSWEVTTGTTRRFVNESNTYTLNIQSDATVVAYATAGATDSAPIAVSILNQYNKPFHNVALAGDTTIKFTANAVTIGGTTITIPTMPNYSIVGWTATGYASEIELDKTYTLSEIAGSGTSVVFGPTLTFTKADYTVKLDGVQVAAGVYDDLVTVNSQVAGTVAIALVQDGAYYVAAYGTSYSMYLNRNVEFVSIVKDGSNYYFSSVSDANRITDTQMTNKLNGGLPFVYSIMSVTGQNSSGTNKYTTFTATSANCTIEVTEVGTLYSKTASTDDTLVMGGSGVYSAAAKNPSATTNQFSYTIATKGNLYTRGYVKYTVTYTNAGGSATMQCIDYGNICTNAAN